MSAAITEGYAGVTRILTADKPEPTEQAMTPERFEALMDDLSRRMREAELEFGHPQVPTIKGFSVTAVWDEQD